MSFAPIAIKTTIPATAPAATSGVLTFSTIEDENWLQITGDASAGSGSLYLLRWNATLSVWHPYMGDKPIAVDSAAFSGLFSAYYPFPKGDESFVLYDPTGTITATASAARTGSPLVAPAPASSSAAGGATAAKQDAGNASLAMIATQQTDGTQKTQVTSSALPTGAATAAKQPAIGTAGTPSADVLSVQGVAGGTPQPVSPQARSATPAASFVDASASSVTLLAANASRKSASFFNNSNADLYLLETGGTADTTTGFTTVLRAAGGWHELPIGADGSITTGAITGIWASAGISGVAVCERV